MLITGAQIYTAQGVLKNAALEVVQNKIHRIDDRQKFSAADALTFPDTYHLIPGLIDLHIHGAQGKDVMDGDHAALAALSAAAAQEGVTGFLATTMTADVDKITHVLANVASFVDKSECEGAAILGVHLEGPFLSPQKVGAQRADKILAPDIELIKKWQATAKGLIKLITIAPELPHSLECIRYLKQQNIVASIGHTEASYDQAIAAMQAGCTHVTHLFNAMRGLHQREPGVVGAALLSDDVSAEIIVDGVHLHPAIVELVLRLKKNAVLVTDAMRAQCMPDGMYDLGDQAVEVQKGIARLQDGTLAGSTLTMIAALRNLLKFTRCDLSDAVKLGAENPARVLGIFDRKGSLAVGKDADLVVLDENLHVVLTVVAGNVVYPSAIIQSAMHSKERKTTASRG